MNITPTVGNWLRLDVNSSGSGTINYTLTDLTAGKVSSYTNSNSNVPTVAMWPQMMEASVNATAACTVDLDYVAFIYRGLNR